MYRKCFCSKRRSTAGAAPPKVFYVLLSRRAECKLWLEIISHIESCSFSHAGKEATARANGHQVASSLAWLCRSTIHQVAGGCVVALKAESHASCARFCSRQTHEIMKRPWSSSSSNPPPNATKKSPLDWPSSSSEEEEEAEASPVRRFSEEKCRCHCLSCVAYSLTYTFPSCMRPCQACWRKRRRQGGGKGGTAAGKPPYNNGMALCFSQKDFYGRHTGQPRYVSSLLCSLFVCVRERKVKLTPARNSSFPPLEEHSPKPSASPFGLEQHTEEEIQKIVDSYITDQKAVRPFLCKFIRTSTDDIKRKQLTLFLP